MKSDTGNLPGSFSQSATVAGRLLRFAALRMQSMHNRHLFLWDVASQPVVIVAAFSLRLEQLNPPAYEEQIWVYGLLSTLIVPSVFYLLGMYRRFWRYASSSEVELIMIASVVGCLVTAVLIFVVLVPTGQLRFVPRSIPFLATMLTVLFAALPRYAIHSASRYRALASKPRPTGEPIPVLIAGAGEAGHTVLRELQANPQLHYLPVGVVDDDPSKHGLRMFGCSVLGSTDEIPELARRRHIERLVIAMPSASGTTLRRIASRAAEAGIPVLTLPGVYELIAGDVSISRLRSISVEDLLRREPVEIDREQVLRLIRGRRVLVTGGGGSIGSELCRQVASCNPDRLIALGHGENSIYQIGRELEQAYPRLALSLQVADIRDKHRLDEVFRTQRPDIVLHAAAHKHVPLMEENIPDAITNNVQGTANVVRAADTFDVRHLVMISSDKAVNPTSVMGVTKRIAELIVQEAALKSGRSFVVVRFGNVLGSRGSVVPLFERQIAAGGPVTITHPDVTRYFMTIPEAVQLVLQAAAFGRGGEIFVLDMGEPVRISDLAEDMISLSGLLPGEDIEIRTVGLRPGEKLFEELNVRDEHHVPSPHEKIFVLRPGSSQSDQRGTSNAADEDVAQLLDAAERGDLTTARLLLKKLVPEYVPDNWQA
ncbi:MAG: nucleoside-diphosphate sugar epimerase/dehydratase [Anaerolineae bacterium]